MNRPLVLPCHVSGLTCPVLSRWVKRLLRYYPLFSFSAPESIIFPLCGGQLFIHEDVENVYFVSHVTDTVVSKTVINEIVQI